MYERHQQEILPLKPESERKMHKMQARAVNWKTLHSAQFGKSHSLSLLTVM
jgi:hypothetical protein